MEIDVIRRKKLECEQAIRKLLDAFMAETQTKIVALDTRFGDKYGADRIENVAVRVELDIRL